MVLEWTLPGGAAMDEGSLDELYRELVVKIQDLMLTLAGPDAR